MFMRIKSSVFDDREVDRHHHLAPAQEMKKTSFNQRLCWLKEATNFSNDSETALKLSLKCPVSSSGAF